MADLLDRLRRPSAPWLFGKRVDGSCEREVAEPPQRPLKRAKRVEIMVSGNLVVGPGPGDVQAVREAINGLQLQLVANAGRSAIELRVTAFVDECIHRSPWHTRAVDVGHEMLRWHCTPGRTAYVEALRRAVEERVDLVLMVGAFIDDDWDLAARQAKALRKADGRVVGLHIGADRASYQAFQDLAQSGGGSVHALPSASALRDAVPILVDSIMPAGLPCPPARNSGDIAPITRLFAGQSSDVKSKTATSW
jgi:hypothetical protein